MRRYAQTNLELYGQLQRLEFGQEAMNRAGAGYRAAMRLFSACFRPSGKTFLAHLVGTASVLAEERASIDVVVAGLLHAAYTHGEFGTSAAGVSAAKRSWMRAAIGTDAEDWVARYTAFHWSPGSATELVGRADGLTSAERTLVLMRAANELDEMIDLGLAHRANGSAAIERARERVALAARLMRADGRDTLADELETLHAAQPAGALPEVAQDDTRFRWLQGKGSSYLLPPLSHALRPSVAVRRALRRSVRRMRVFLRPSGDSKR